MTAVVLFRGCPGYLKRLTKPPDKCQNRLATISGNHISGFFRNHNGWGIGVT